MTLRFDTDFDPHHGVMTEVSPLVRRLVCDNPSKYTFHGTGTYVVGHGRVAVVDPGPTPDEPAGRAHLDALLAALRHETVDAVLITDTHLDHSPAATALAAATGAPTFGYGPHPADATAESGDEKSGDEAFTPDTPLEHLDVVDGPGWTIDALYTPGHISNHLCFALREERAVFTGDHVMGWSSTVIPPPDGDIGAYLRSLELLMTRDDAVYHPTHGGSRHDAVVHAAALHRHRLERERQIVDQLVLGPRSAGEIVAVLYAEVREELHAPATRSVLAHLVELERTGRARNLGDTEDRLDPAATWERAGANVTRR